MRKGIMVLLVFLCLLLGGGTVAVFMMEDRTGPEIIIPDGAEIRYVEGSDSSDLLRDVRAVDAREGDVSDSLLVENVFPNNTKTEASAVLVAKDSKNNVTKTVRQVKYVSDAQDSGKEQDGGDGAQNSDERIPEGSAAPESAEASGDQVEGTLPEDGGSVSQNESDNEAAIAALPAGSPRLYLSEYEVTIAQGSSFNSLSYVKEITDDNDSRDDLYENIQIQGDVDINTSGSYDLRYYVVDSSGNRSNEAVLTVHVQ